MLWSKIKASCYSHWPYLVSLAVFLLLTITNPHQPYHSLRNIEPYPDGLYYLQTSQNLVNSRGLTLTYQDVSLKPKIPPLYSLVLSIGYAVLSSPISFYYVNLALALASFTLGYASLKSVTDKKSVQFLSLLLLALQGYIAWFVTLPMAENLGLFLITAATYLILKRTSFFRNRVLLLLISWALIFTKYVYLPISGLIVLYSLGPLITGKKWKDLLQSGAVLVVGLVLFGFFLRYIDFNPLMAFGQNNFVNQPVFFSFSLSASLGRILHYLAALISGSSSVLWLHFPFAFGLCSGLLLVTGVGGIPRKQLSSWWFLLLVALSPLALLQFFYILDLRYLLTFIPVGIILFAAGLGQLSQRYSKWWFLAILAIFLQFVSQLGFYRLLITSNLLFRSHAWQYEATKFISDHTSPGEYVITALPPYLFTIYEKEPELAHLLPLSQHQEFINKLQPAWGTQVPLEDLNSYYKTLLVQQKTVYISNAYVTHQQAVTVDFENLKEIFKLELVAEGCAGTCNLYRLSISQP